MEFDGSNSGGKATVRIVTAGWSIPRESASAFPAEGSGLVRYASVLNAVEINSTFYRPHREATFSRWRDSVPPDFRFAAKAPRLISHELRLAGAEQAFADFIAMVAPLGDRQGPILIQLPPSLAFEMAVAGPFFQSARRMTPAPLVLEPRHPTWFSEEATAMLTAHGVSRAGADPERVPGALEPAGDMRLRYLRLHGSPQIYVSRYGSDMIERLAALCRPASDLWIVFDNTVQGAAMANALELMALTRREARV